MGGASASAPLEDRPGALEHRSDAQAPHQITEAVTDEDHADLVQARQVAHRTERHFTHARTYFVFFASACWRRASAKPASRPLVASVMLAP